MPQKTKAEMEADFAALEASVVELTRQLRSKDEALATQRAHLDHLAEQLAELEEQGQLLAAQGAELSAVQDSTEPSLDEAIQVLKREGFRILTEVKIEDCKDATEPRRRSFRNRGRWEVALVCNRLRTF